MTEEEQREAREIEALDVRALLGQKKKLLIALVALLDDADRVSAGHPQHIEIRFAVRDLAIAAIEEAGK